MERSPDDVPMALRFEPKAVVVFNIVHVWAFSGAGLLCWLLPSATLEHSVQRQALRSEAHLWGCCLRISQRSGVTAPLGGAGRNPTRPSLGQRASVATSVWAIIHVFSSLARCFAHSHVSSS